MSGLEERREGSGLPPFARLFDRAGHVVSVHRGPDHVYVYTNPAGRERVGRDPIGLPLAEVCPQLVSNGFVDRYDEAFRSGRGQTFPVQGMSPFREEAEGRPPRWVRHAIQPWLDEDGEVAGVISTVADVTEEHERTLSLERDQSERDAGYEEMSTVGSWDVLADGETVIFDDAMVSLFGHDGVTAGEPAPIERVFAHVHEDDVKQTRAAFDAAREGGGRIAFSHRVRGPDGSLRTVEAIGRVVREADGRARMVGVSFDVTDARRREEALERLATQSRLFKTLVESSDDYIGVADGNDIPIFANDTVVALSGLPIEEVLSRPFTDLFAPEDREFLTGTILPAVDREGRWTGEIRLLNHEDGRRTPIHYDVFALHDPDTGERTHTATISRDLTEQKRAEEHRQLLVDELNHRVKNTMAVVQAIAQQTFKNVPAAADAVATFRGRLSALAGAHDVLTVERWQTADLRRTVAGAMDGCGAPAERVAIGGPNASLPGRFAVSLAMAIHELCTNATKYGALSGEGGDVSIGWTIEEEDDHKRLFLTWRERGGPTVAPPSREGFGMLMIQRSLAREVDGGVHMDWAPQGLTCSLQAVLGAPRDE